MDSLLSIDAALFRFVNQTLANGVLDLLMPWCAGGPWFPALVAVIAALLCWKGGRRGRLFVVMAMLAVVLTDVVICGPMKQAIGRMRPFHDLPEARVLVNRGASASMPSSHAANWFALAMVAWIYYRRRAWIVLVGAVVVAFSRVYVGVHYPADVLVGALVGAGAGAAAVIGAQMVWQRFVRDAFPRLAGRMPSLLNPEARAAVETVSPEMADRSAALVRFGYFVIAITLLARLWYVGAGRIELSEDEAYQWVWSKHLALSYYSKPPMIAYAQFVGTSLWGDNEFGVRFLSPVITALLSLVLLRFLAREVNARAALGFVLLSVAVPLLAVGGVLMTVDPLAALFWALSMISMWRAMHANSLRHWVLTGVWMGLGFLSKYTTPLLLACWAVFFLVHRPARAHLRRPGPWLALAVCALFTLPVIVWNAQHGWITVTHLSERGGMDHAWRFTLRFFNDFVLTEFGLLNPVIFVGAIWAAVAMWRSQRTPFEVFCFCLSVPVWLFYLALTMRARVYPNWTAVVIVPLLLLVVTFGERRLAAGQLAVRRAFVAALALGIPAVLLLHDLSLIGRFLPESRDPSARLHRSRGTARIVGAEWARLNAGGTPAFIIGGHYGLVGVVSFYLPEAKERVASGSPLAYYLTSDVPKNQFYFWPGYRARRGENAIFVHEADAPKPPPERLLREFRSVTDLGVREVVHRGRVVDRVQLFECRELL